MSPGFRGSTRERHGSGQATTVSIRKWRRRLVLPSSSNPPTHSILPLFLSPPRLFLTPRSPFSQPTFPSLFSRSSFPKLYKYSLQFTSFPTLQTRAVPFLLASNHRTTR
ncbi:hypothetical protein NL676_020075 [Syzygium grande]|nr:hypothetical protein NL676_020075 [Syzygium grande]